MKLIFVFACGLSLLSAGCVTQPPRDERAVLFDVTQLTHGFVRAGEAYFAPDSRWIVFQATPRGAEHYEMYVAPLEHVVANQHPPGTSPARLGKPVRVSPAGSKNTCGFFSPDGRSLIFASTAGKEVRPATAGTATSPATRSVAPAW